MRHTTHQRHMAQLKFHYKYHKYERNDKEILRHDGLKVRTGIISSHAKQDCKLQAIFKCVICYGS